MSADQSVLSPALLAAVGLVLLASGLAHLRQPGALGRALALHGVLPARLLAPVRSLLTVAEVGLGALLLAAVVTPVVPVLPVAGLGAALCAAFTAYLVVVRRATAGGDPVPCGCGIGETEIGPAAVARAGVLTVLAVVGGLAPAWDPARATAVESGVVVAAGLTLALVTAFLPAARALPAGTPAPVRGGR